MATLEPGYIYFLENKGAWLTDSTPTDPEDIIIADFTAEGTDYCKIELPQRWVKTFKTGITVTDAGGGTSFEHRASVRGYSFLSEGLKTSIINADLVEQFFMIDAHTSGASATFKDYYMVIKFDTDVYVKFKDESASTMEKYCPVRLLSGNSTWDENSPQSMTIRLNLRSKW